FVLSLIGYSQSQSRRSCKQK
ncbi:hypothetical protein VCHENC02_1420B, partial [Vibrio harveyi]